jgi:hypothetical protein
VESDDDKLDPRFALILATPSVGVIAVWIFTLTNEWFLYTQESVPVYSLTIEGGGIASLFGMAVSMIGLCNCDRRSRRWWQVSLVLNAAGLMANLMGFLVYMC